MTHNRLVISAVVIFVLSLLVGSFYFYWGNPNNITILYTADIHGHLGIEKQAGGFLKIATEIEKQKKKDKDVLLLDGGDALHGSFYAHLTKGELPLQLMDECGYDAMVIGNHEFGWGWERLRHLKSKARLQMLSANILKDNGEYLAKPYVIKKIKDLNVAIIALTTPHTPQLTHPKNTKGLHFLDPQAVAQKLLEKLQNKIDFLILLTHLGYSEDRKLAEELPYKSDYVIIGGHSHTKLTFPKILTNSFGAKVFICHPGEHGEYVGKLSLWLKKGKIVHFKHKLISTVNNKPYSSGVLANYEEILDQAHKPLFYVKRNYSRERLAEILCKYMGEATDSDFALLNHGTIRSSLARGMLTQKLIHKILPFEDKVVYVFLDGATLSRILWRSNATDYQPASLVCFAREKNFTIMPNKIYKVAMSDFLAEGGDGYFQNIDKVYTTDYTLRDLFVEALWKKK